MAVRVELADLVGAAGGRWCMHGWHPLGVYPGIYIYVCAGGQHLDSHRG